jgi:hypothetical protein
LVLQNISKKGYTAHLRFIAFTTDKFYYKVYFGRPLTNLIALCVSMPLLKGGLEVGPSGLPQLLPSRECVSLSGYYRYPSYRRIVFELNILVTDQ